MSEPQPLDWHVVSPKGDVTFKEEMASLVESWFRALTTDAIRAELARREAAEAEAKRAAKAMLAECWGLLNRRRGMLIDRQICGDITSCENAELDALNDFADRYVEATTPRPTARLEELAAKVKHHEPKR